ncbi:MAG: hypothetical protein LLF83_00845 [Methanobacterium sp.]|nr:hypothetical protein [Methanobacterium sp.]
MNCKKIMYIPEAQDKGLREIMDEVKENGGYVSCNRLLIDCVAIFLEKYKDQAVIKHSPGI